MADIVRGLGIHTIGFAILAFGILSRHAEGQSPGSLDASPLKGLIAHAVHDPQGEAPNTFRTSDFQSNLEPLPIGVFDSGLGGLTVLEAILTLDAFNNENLQPGGDGRPDFENERFIYLGDQANMPYGNYNASGKGDFLRELVLKDAIFLLGRRDRKSNLEPASFEKPPVKAIVIACNTATAVGLEDIRSAIKTWQIPIPVIGVVEAGAEAVRDLTPTVGPDSTIAVLATVGTCSTEAYPKTIQRVLGLAGRRVPNVIQQGSIGIAGAIEGDPSFVWKGNPQSRPQPYRGPKLDSGIESSQLTEKVDSQTLFGWNDQDLVDRKLNSVGNYIQFDVGTLVEKHRLSGSQKQIQTVVLGCTHFPLVKQEIEQALERLREVTLADGKKPYQHCIAEKIEFVNPAEDAAKALFRQLAQSRLRLKSPNRSVMDRNRFYMSQPNLQFSGAKLSADKKDLDPEYKYGRNLGIYDQEDTVPVLLQRDNFPASARGLVESRLPAVWKELGPKLEDQASGGEAYEWTFPVMGTTMTLRTYGTDPVKVKEIFEETKSQVEKYQSILSDYDPESEASTICDPSRIGKWQSVSRPLWEVLEGSDLWNRRTDGMFDASLGELTRLWRAARKKKELPSAEAIERALGRSGWKRVELRHDQKEIRLLEEVRLDFGAIAKGWIVEQAFQNLRSHGLPISLVQSGGDLRCGEAPPGRSGWRVQLGKISDQDQESDMLSLSHVAVASSGDLFQYVEVEGKRFSHVLDPRTGIGIVGQRMATVIAPNAMDADACATAMCILGHEAGQRLAASLPQIEVRIASRETDEVSNRVSLSKGFPSGSFNP